MTYGVETWERMQDIAPSMVESEIGDGDLVFSVSDDVTRRCRAKWEG
jgi:hypothetical protein